MAEMESPFFICSCFFYKHIFLQRYRIHVDFHSQEQFTRDYGKVSPVRDPARLTYAYVITSFCVTQLLKERGCDENDFSVILEDVSIYERTQSSARVHVLLHL